MSPQRDGIGLIADKVQAVIFLPNSFKAHMAATASELHPYLSTEQHLKIRDAALITKLCSSDAVRAANLAVLAANILPFCDN